MAKTVKYTIYCGFSSLSDIDKITPVGDDPVTTIGFSSLSDIDKITHDRMRTSH